MKQCFFSFCDLPSQHSTFAYSEGVSLFGELGVPDVELGLSLFGELRLPEVEAATWDFTHIA